MNPQSIASQLFGSIEWIKADSGFMRCPGSHLHTHRTGKRDTKIFVSGAPTVYCFHSSCSGVIDQANLALRRALSGEKTDDYIRQYEVKKAPIEEKTQDIENRVKEFAKHTKATVLSEYQWGAATAWEDSPHRLSDNIKDDWKLLLSLFSKDDVIWSGDVSHSSQDDTSYTRYFQPVSQWLKNKPLGQFTCPSTFKHGTHSRSNSSVVERKFLVIESDTLSQDEITSIFKFCQRVMVLRAIVFTGGKSLHGWFDFPSLETLQILSHILPEWDCDEALFKPSQPVRLPGVARGDKYQSLLYFAPNDNYSEKIRLQ